MFSFALAQMGTMSTSSDFSQMAGTASLLNGRTSLSELQSGNLGNEASIMQILNMERAKGTQKSTLNSAHTTDSLSMFLTPDSALEVPLDGDTLYYRIETDTIPLDSVRYDHSIVAELGILADQWVIVKRRIPISKEEQPPERYEAIFFKNKSGGLFSSTTNAVDADYPLKAGDELVLTLWGEVEKESKLQINNQGRVLVEGIGLISLNGLNLGKAEQVLRTRLSRIYSGIRHKKTFVNLRLESLSPVKVFMVGEVEKPGGYVFYGNTDVFHGLYMAEGPNEIGSVRSIQVSRSDTTLTVDLYDYLMHGHKSKSSVLYDGDIVYLPRAEMIVEIKGDVGRPGRYELKKGETLKDLILYAGGVNVTTANQTMILQRIFPSGRQDFMDLKSPYAYLQGQDSFTMQDGDILTVSRSSDLPKEYITVIGAVKYPGTYQYQDSMKVPNVIRAAGGLLESTYQGRVQVLRTLVQGGNQMYSQPLEGENLMSLLPRDTVIVYDQQSMYIPDSVTISGAVMNPGAYLFQSGMKAKDLILLAGGFLPNREKGVLRIEHVRSDSRGMEVLYVNVADNYDFQTSQDIALRPWDHVEVPIDANFHRPYKVKLAGAFKKPGEYSLLYPGERIKDLIARTGGFQEDAFLDGAQFFRAKDSIGRVGIELKKALAGAKLHNVELQHGDSLFVPVPSVHVRVMGEVGFPSSVLYRPGKDISWYIAKAGGFKESSAEDQVMIQYANGSVSTAEDADRDPDPGSLIVVPYREPDPPINWVSVAGAVASILSAVATTIAAYAALNN